MPKRAPRYFLVVLVDDDFGTFNVLGPMTDDTEITKRAIELRKSGRRVRLTSTQPECELAKTPNPEAYAARVASELKLRHDPNLRGNRRTDPD